MVGIEKMEFQKLKKEETNTLLKWAEDEGWNPGPFDADVFWATDPNGFYGYFHENSLIAGGSVVSYNGEFGFMGLFIVKPGYRSAGIGRKLWFQRRDTLLARLRKGATIGMDGVVAMQPFYTKGGFRIAFRDERFEKTGMEFPADKHISAILPGDFEAVLAYDRKCFGFLRPGFLFPWLSLPGGYSFKYTENGQIEGFAVMRKAGIGYKIGPLYAETGQVAEMLYCACLNSAIGEPVYLDVPSVNTEALSLVEKYGAKYVFECARMYYGNPPDFNTGNVFGITTLELG